MDKQLKTKVTEGEEKNSDIERIIADLKNMLQEDKKGWKQFRTTVRGKRVWIREIWGWISLT